MKKSKRLYVFLMFGGMVSNMLFSEHQLSHMCAYSNESVVRFRDKTLHSDKMNSLTMPEVAFDWPIDLCKFWVSSLYGMRKRPSGPAKLHAGVDLAALKGTPVVAAAAGKIKSVNYNMAGYGNMVEIQHGKSSFITRYAHLHSIDISEGKKIKKGQQVGTVGATGNVRGADPSHLHFELIKDGLKVDPLHYLFSSEINYKNLKK